MLTLCIGTLVGCTANAGVVKGTVTFRGGAFGSDASAADAVVVLHGPKGAPVAGRATIDQRQHRFVPRVLAVTSGTTVEFPNHDDVHHNVYSRSPADRFDLGLYPPGETRSTVLEKPGMVEIRCSAHSDMKAYVVVSVPTSRRSRGRARTGSTTSRPERTKSRCGIRISSRSGNPRRYRRTSRCSTWISICARAGTRRSPLLTLAWPV